MVIHNFTLNTERDRFDRVIDGSAQSGQHVVAHNWQERRIHPFTRIGHHFAQNWLPLTVKIGSDHGVMRVAHVVTRRTLK